MSNINKTKKSTIMCYCILILVAILFVGAVIYYINRPLDSCVTISGIQNGTQNQGNSVLAKIGDEYYEIASTNEFTTMFSFDEWEKSSSTLSGEPVMLLQFAELWVVELYSDGQVAAYNGYAALGKKSYAYYKMPESAVEQVISYIEEKGISHEYGDGTIGMATFKH